MRRRGLRRSKGGEATTFTSGTSIYFRLARYRHKHTRTQTLTICIRTARKRSIPWRRFFLPHQFEAHRAPFCLSLSLLFKPRHLACMAVRFLHCLTFLIHHFLSLWVVCKLGVGVRVRASNGYIIHFLEGRGSWLAGWILDI